MVTTGTDGSAGGTEGTELLLSARLPLVGDEPLASPPSPPPSSPSSSPSSPSSSSVSYAPAVKAAAFWDGFYAESTSDEWILDVDEALVGAVVEALPKRDGVTSSSSPPPSPPSPSGQRVLEIGCGSSTLGLEVYKALLSTSKVGCPLTVECTDVSSLVVSQCTHRDSSHFPRLSYSVLDALSSLGPPSHPSTLSCVLDKGCLDTFLFRYPTSATIGSPPKPLVHALLDNIHSALSPDGVYVLVSPRKRIQQLRDYRGFLTVERRVPDASFSRGKLDRAGEVANAAPPSPSRKPLGSAYIYVCTKDPSYSPTSVPSLAFRFDAAADPLAGAEECGKCKMVRGEGAARGYNDRKWVGHLRHCQNSVASKSEVASRKPASSSPPPPPPSPPPSPPPPLPSLFPALPPACLCCATPFLAHSFSSASSASSPSSSPASSCVVTYDLSASVKVHQITDAGGTCPPSWLFPDVSPADLAASYPSGGVAALSFGCVLLQTETSTVLCDTSAGPSSFGVLDRSVFARPAGRRDGDLRELLFQAGVSPDDVDVVVHTHLHRDHTHWNTVPADRKEGEEKSEGLVPLFRNAKHLVQRAEHEYWTSSPMLMEHCGYATSFEPLVAANMLQLVDGDHCVCDGVYLRMAAGHTPGHQIVEIELEEVEGEGGGGGGGGGEEKKAKKAYFVGDLLHQAAQVSHPEWEPLFDWNKKAARKSRTELLERIEREGASLISPHLPFPGVGVVRSGKYVGRIPGRNEEEGEGGTSEVDREKEGGGAENEEVEKENESEGKQRKDRKPEATAATAEPVTGSPQVDANDPVAFWGAWSKAHDECMRGEDEGGVKCGCFEGLGSVM